MKPWQRLTLLAGVVAVIAHLITVWAVPRLIMREAMSRIGQETAAQGVAQAATGVYLPPPTDHAQRRIVMPSPDLLYATCAADLSRGPLRVSARVEHPRYWSIALYGANSDNFFVVNDREAMSAPTSGRIDLWITAPDTDRDPSKVPDGATVVEAPSTRILLLMRLLLTDDPADLASAQVARATLRCGGEPAKMVTPSARPAAAPTSTTPRSTSPFKVGADGRTGSLTGAADPVEAFLRWRRAQLASGRIYADPESPACQPGGTSSKVALGDDVTGALIGDLNGDGRDDAYLAPGTWLCGGGNAFTLNDILVLSTPEGYVVDDDRLVEARNRADFDLMALQRLARLADGTLVLEGTGYRYRDDDPRCCPSIERPVRYDVQRDRVTVR